MEVSELRVGKESIDGLPYKSESKSVKMERYYLAKEDCAVDHQEC